MADDRACEAELAAVMRSDLATSGAQIEDEVIEAVIAAARSLSPPSFTRLSLGPTHSAHRRC